MKNAAKAVVIASKHVIKKVCILIAAGATAMATVSPHLMLMETAPAVLCAPRSALTQPWKYTVKS
jgi:hypothetical protein